MAPNDLISRLTPDVNLQIFGFLFDHEKQLYKATIEAIAKQRKLRSVFIERKPRNERFAWLQEALSRRASEGIAAHLLQIWLVGAHSALLCDFLDNLGIAHDDNGTVETLPPAPPTEQLASAVESLFTKHDPAVVAVYLHAFQSLDEEGGWPSLAELLESDPRLKLREPAAA